MDRHNLSRRAVIGGMTTGVLADAEVTAAQGQAHADEMDHPAPSHARERIIDFRVRPLFRSFRVQMGGGNPADPDQPSDEQVTGKFVENMEAAGIDMAVVMGRTALAPGMMHAMIPNDDIVDLIKRYPRKFVGFGSVDVRAPRQAVAEVDRCAALGFKGIAFDNPLSSPPLYSDDESLLPIYERCAKNNLIISINSSAMIGAEISYSDPVHVQRVANQFPENPIVVTHAAWPYTTQMIAVA